MGDNVKLSFEQGISAMLAQETMDMLGLGKGGYTINFIGNFGIGILGSLRNNLKWSSKQFLLDARFDFRIRRFGILDNLRNSSSIKIDEKVGLNSQG